MAGLRQYSRSRGWGRAAAVLPLCAGLLVGAAPAGASSDGGTTSRVSVASDGTPANRVSWHSAISGDGRYVAYFSYATNLVADDINGTRDVFVHDRETGETTLVSVSSQGLQGVDDSYDPDISADGRYIAFASDAGNLVAADANPTTDVFVHDRQTGETTLVSKSSGGVQGGGASSEPSISADGRYVAFSSSAANLITGDTNLAQDVFVHDRQTGATVRASVSSGGPPTGGIEGNALSGHPSISGDGSAVAFHSDAATLLGVGGDTNGRTDVFVHDRTSATTSRVSVASDGTEGDNQGLNPAISGDGRVVAFQANSTNLVPGDTNSDEDVFVHDRTSATTTRVSVADDEAQANDFSFWPEISADGRQVGFASAATNLMAGDTSGRQDIFFRDRLNGSTTRVNVGSDGSEDNGGVHGRFDINSDGGHVAFGSLGTNLVPNDTPDGPGDVFVHSRPPTQAVLSVGNVAVHEGDSGTRAAVFTVSLSEPATVSATVDYATADAGATSGDYTPKAGTLSFPPGVTSLTVKIPVAGDTADETDETFNLALSAPSGAVIGDGIGVGTIVDDDPKTITGRRLAIGDVAVHEGDSGTRVAVFNVSLSKASTSYVTASFATGKGTAVGRDFTAHSGTLSFAPGSTSKSVTVAITPDTAVEGDESFTVSLSGASGATIADGTGLGTIVDND